MEDVKGLVYIITNTETSKNYIGQTLTHRLNKGKYKLFGIEGRFKDHISEAVCNTKKKQCTYLNNSIRQYGKDKFTVELLHTCEKNDLDKWEKHYIKEYNSLFPNGYNLTAGGKTGKNFSNEVIHPKLNQTGKRGGCKERTKETRQRISESNKEVFDNDKMREFLMRKAQSQHTKQKFDRFKDVNVDHKNLDQYIYTKNSNLVPMVVVKVGNISTSFVGKYDTIDDLKQRAKEFLLKLPNSATLSNCSGNP